MKEHCVVQRQPRAKKEGGWRRACIERINLGSRREGHEWKLAVLIGEKNTKRTDILIGFVLTG